MLSSALIIFREVFEVVLIVGIILAATRGIAHRQKAIYLGFGTGLLGSVLVAIFMNKISAFAEGVGQEIFNAGVLFTAAAFIGWTVIWMKRHSHEMKGHFAKVGQAVSDGSLPFFSLSIVIALAILREGSEIALFTYGMLASGQSPSALMLGSFIGLVSGGILGGLVYLGLIRISTKYFFRITSALLIVLVAGMMSQAVGFLTAAGAFESLSQTVWDTSWFIGERGILGQSLKALIGYTAQPSLIQIIIYTLTLGTLIMFTKSSGTQRIKSQSIAVIALAAISTCLIPAQAHATKKVYAPYVEQGELELEYRGGYDIDDDNDVDGAWKQKVGVGYGVNSFWFTEVYGEVEKEGENGADSEFSAIEWENKFQLTQRGQYWLDLGLLTELEYNTAGGADKAEVAILLAKDTGKFTHLANLVAERQFGEDSEDATEFGASWSSRYRYNAAFEPGFEIHSEFGRLDDGSSFSEEDHRIGPVFYGKIGSVKYDVGYLVGVSNGAPDGMVKALLEYEWSF